VVVLLNIHKKILSKTEFGMENINNAMYVFSDCVSTADIILAFELNDLSFVIYDVDAGANMTLNNRNMVRLMRHIWGMVAKLHVFATTFALFMRVVSSPFRPLYYQNHGYPLD